MPFVELAEPGQEPRLIEVSSSQADYETGWSLLYGWEYVSTKGIDAKRSPRTGFTWKRWDNAAVICLEIKPNRQAHVHLTKVTKGTLGETDKHGTDLTGGGERWSWMEMAETQCRAQKDYSHVPNGGWNTTRPYSIDYKEESSKPDTHDLIVRPDGSPDDLTDSNWIWDENCVKRKTVWTPSCLTRTTR